MNFHKFSINQLAKVTKVTLSLRNRHVYRGPTFRVSSKHKLANICKYSSSTDQNLKGEV